jgi:hypothetical protein
MSILGDQATDSDAAGCSKDGHWTDGQSSDIRPPLWHRHISGLVVAKDSSGNIHAQASTCASRRIERLAGVQVILFNASAGDSGKTQEERGDFRGLTVHRTRG